jgi:cell division protein FtsL
MKGLKLRKIVGLFALVLLAAGVLVAHVGKQNAYIRISRESAKLAQGEARLRNQIALLEMEIGELRRFSRIEALARERFGLEYAKATVLVYPEPAAETAAGETPQAGKVAWRTSAL